ncbi:ATP synthase F1, delta subunit [Chloroherpeton thalassium ATCC 35110]|uniref:ATP synthase subunit delta n=1 Tax=Chloroherpeton thalassium (strain ATCC 35110 / GB-78) TaxID=517418 RepID=ATPD_CHLT3|nr:ATP synthase F1 subunit delta [Chloroherpeton thalassium]B3QZF1.1 RecName: Full=ATP synthase subunit delta; AltName: Full=ATP synthase F(1) sector subunit delta; AltName: Full=F-type ATPase subunit delta; Short=F-ATPase subunit delta [Chloroherpeton thalassium ATCC 35110]ACF13844.1 ATP synthase F1, delta subunit [Chloroherpeton thalassium ATCC 35110]
MHSISIVGRRYALALMEVAVDQNIVGQVMADFELIEQTMVEAKQLRLAIQSPLIQAYKKAALLKEVFGGKVSQQVATFLFLLASKNRAEYLPEVIQEYRALLDEQNGVISVDIKTAVDLDDKQTKQLKDKLEAYTSKKVRVHLATDKQLIGGLTIQIGDTVLDGSIRHQLAMLKNNLAAGALN